MISLRRALKIYSPSTIYPSAITPPTIAAK